MRRLFLTVLAASLLAAPAFAGTIHAGIDGLVCAFCASGIQKSFMKQQGVSAVEVDMDKKLVTVTTAAGATLSDAQIKQVVTDAGFNLTTIHRME